jgi:lysophospholipase L1-like esterase
VKATSPVAAEISWVARDQATGYRIYRNDAALAEIDASAPRSFVDEGLTPGQTYTYYIEALAHDAPRPSVMKGAAPHVVKTSKVLEVSHKKGAVTPIIDTPRDFTISTDPHRKTVHATWSAPKWGSTVAVLRDGAQIATVASTAAAFDDAAAPSGTHSYALRPVYAPAPGKPTFTGQDSATLSLKLGPLRIVAFGDSIMWGQGLADSAKFTTLTREALKSTLLVDVELTSFAHSGAVVRNAPGPIPAPGVQEPTGFDQARLITPGEIPNGFPTILNQINVQSASMGSTRADVELVLVDGCINDVDVVTILNPTTTPQQVQSKTVSKCAAMSDVLLRAHELFPNASIVMTGYYPIVSPMTDLTALPVFVASSVGVAALATPLVGLPPDPALQTVAIAAGLGLPGPLRTKMSANSMAFRTASDTTLAGVASTVNQTAHQPGLVTYVPLAFDPQNSYASPASLLWLIPTGLYPGDQDDVIASRRAQCSAPGVVDTSQGFPIWKPTDSEMTLAKGKCPIASMGHPNRKGAQLYSQKIMQALQPALTRWRDRFATTRRAPL